MSDDDMDRLASIAAQLVARVREDPPDLNGPWLTEQLPDPQDWYRLCFVLAAAVPTDVSWSVLTSWTHRLDRGARELKPHGTGAAVERHRYNKTRLCELCRAYERERKAAYRQREVA